MSIFSKFETKMEDTFDEIGDKMFDSPISPVQIAKKCEKEMRRGKMVGAGKQYAPTLYTILVNVQDDRRLMGYYPTLAGETETYLEAKANEQGLAIDGHPLVRFIADESLKHGKFDVVAEAVAGVIVEQLRAEENERYGINDKKKAAPTPAPVAQQPAPAAPAQPETPSAFAPYDVNAANAAAMDIAKNGPAKVDANDGFGEVVQKPEATAAPAPEAPLQQAPAPEAQVAGAAPTPKPEAAPAAEAQGAPSNENFSSAPTQIFNAAVPQNDAMPPAHFRDMASGRIYSITQDTSVIGRDRTCNLCLDDANASRQHAKLQYSGGMWILSDLGSTNGTFINDVQITSRQILPGDVATVGITSLEFNVG